MAKQYRVQLVLWLNVEAGSKNEAIVIGREWTQQALLMATKQIPHKSIQHPIVPRLRDTYLKEASTEEAIPLDGEHEESGN